MRVCRTGGVNMDRTGSGEEVDPGVAPGERSYLRSCFEICIP